MATTYWTYFPDGTRANSTNTYDQAMRWVLFDGLMVRDSNGNEYARPQQ